MRIILALLMVLWGVPVHAAKQTIGDLYVVNNVGVGTTSPAAPLQVSSSVGETWGTGGDTITNYDAGSGVYYRIHKFTTTGNATFVAPSPARSLEVLVIGGGGGGGTSREGGGGGGGRFILNSSYSSTAWQSISITVGNGGNAGSVGQQSVFGTITAAGGGYGGSGAGGTGGNGGSGGGGGGFYTSSAGTGGTTTGGDGYGYNGGNGFIGNGEGAGGGGGAGGAGSSGVNNGGGAAGGAGRASTITGASVTYAKGGNGGGYGYGTASRVASVANSGNGGDGYAMNPSGSGQAGGSGIVIVRYVIPSLGTTAPASFLSSGGIGVGQTTNTASISAKGVGSTSGSKTFNLLNSSNTDLFTVQDGGNVGIGSASPISLLDVKGTARVQGLNADGNIGISTSGATSCVCTNFKYGLCIAGSCT
jgi:hypothetical protein